mmetsp:Transcript_28734/g.65704  ORF Transcript_28734/g.65704 Transcript_28734/m.65704 type:complete len:110 (+) Transcript_28734:169-498(+)
MISSLLIVTVISIFSLSSPYTFTGTSLQPLSVRNQRCDISMEYIPSGISKAQWEKMKVKEASKKRKNLGQTGITKFKSRSFSDWQASGGKNLFPVDPKSVKNKKELPYM